MIKKVTISFLVFSILTIAVSAQPTTFSCPNGNVAVVRASGSALNPISIYNMNTTTGVASLLSGPILDPNNASINLQVNALGLNEVDGLLYGLFSDEPAALTTVPSTPYYRVGANAQAVELGTLMGPPFTLGDNGSFVIPSAGEFDQTGTYYFSAVTGFVNINILNPPASTFTPSTFYIGTVANSSTLPGGTAALPASYVTITNPSNDASGYLASISITISASNAQGLGLQDLVYNNADGHLYTYVHYAAGGGSYYGQMLKINPTTGVMSALAPPVIQPFLTANNFPNGMLIDGNGNFLVMLTNGRIYKAVGGPTTYTGALSLVNTTPGLPIPLTGDMASCGMISIALPDNSLDVTVDRVGDMAAVRWTPKQESHINYYEVEYGTDGISFSSVGKIIATKMGTYTFDHQNYFVHSSHYYRIKIVHQDGAVTYSDVVQLKTSSSPLEVYPNPVGDILKLRFPYKWVGRNVRITLVNHLGQLVLQKEVKDLKSQEHIALAPTFTSGIYFLDVTSNGLSLATHKIHVIR